jgi:hypothetical protein
MGQPMAGRWAWGGVTASLVLVVGGPHAVLAGTSARILPQLGERHRRLLCGAVANTLGSAA